MNPKRVHRLWIAEGLRVPYRKRKKPLRGIGRAMGPFCPIRPNVVWALDFQFDQTSDGRMLKILNVIDEFTREALATDVERSIDADGVVACLERLTVVRGAPAYVRFDNGPEFIATQWLTGAASTTPGRSSSTRAAHGRTPGSRASTAGMRDEHLNGPSTTSGYSAFGGLKGSKSLIASARSHCVAKAW